MKYVRRAATIIFLAVIPMWSVHHLWRVSGMITSRQLFDGKINLIEIQAFLHSALIVIWILFISQVMTMMVKRTTISSIDQHFRFSFHRMVISALAMSPIHQSVPTNSTVTSVPATTLISPSLIAAVLADILQRRRNQIVEKVIPRRFSEKEQKTIQKLISLNKNPLNDAAKFAVVTESEVVDVVRTVDQQQTTETKGADEVNQWQVLIRLYGYPQVESVSGDIAVFRKKRALELTTWLAINRDRARRSAARTALWDIDISDASFSTVVSDMRRAISDVGGVSREELVPVTYTDEIPVHSGVISDFDLLKNELKKFRTDTGNALRLAEILSSIRDVPFAGTSYSWADYDGTTTSMVVTALQASTELAMWAMKHNHVAIAQTAISAGLRVMPGCEELLELNKSLLSCVHTSRSRVSH